MITQVGIEFEGQELVLPILGVTPKASLLIRKITGLNPPEIDLFIGEYSRDGGIYQGRRVGNRNIVLTLDLNPNPALGETISGLRRMLYKALVDPLVEADYLKLNFYHDDDEVWYTVGYTEKFETEPFDIETMVQVSLICPDPYLRNNEMTVLTQPAPGWTTVPFEYDGSAETGFSLEAHINTPTNVLVIENNPVTSDPLSPDYYKGRMIVERSFSNGDIVRLSTVRGSRSITVSPAAIPDLNLSILSNLTPKSPWLELHSQDNTMKIYGTDSSNIVAGIQELRYSSAHWGV